MTMEVKTCWVVVWNCGNGELREWNVHSNNRPDDVVAYYRRNGYAVYLGRRDA
jgi:hypothetical protein